MNTALNFFLIEFYDITEIIKYYFDNNLFLRYNSGFEDSEKNIIH